MIVLYKEELNTIPEDEEKNTKLKPSPSQSKTKRNCEKYISSTFHIRSLKKYLIKLGIIGSLVGGFSQCLVP